MLNDYITINWSPLIVSFVFVFLTSLIKLILGLKFLYRQKVGKEHGGKDQRVLLHFKKRLGYTFRQI